MQLLVACPREELHNRSQRKAPDHPRDEVDTRQKGSSSVKKTLKCPSDGRVLFDKKAALTGESPPYRSSSHILSDTEWPERLFKFRVALQNGYLQIKNTSKSETPPIRNTSKSEIPPNQKHLQSETPPKQKYLRIRNTPNQKYPKSEIPQIRNTSKSKVPSEIPSNQKHLQIKLPRTQPAPPNTPTAAQ